MKWLSKEETEAHYIYDFFGMKFKIRYNLGRRYNDVRQKIINKMSKEKSKVGFLIKENAKWTYQSVYDCLNRDDRFETVVFASCMYSKNTDSKKQEAEKNYEFFKRNGMNVELVYKNGDYINLAETGVDILFYDQPWDMPLIHYPAFVSKFALTMYSPYGIQSFAYERNYITKFHKMLYKYFVEHDLNVKRYESYKKGNSKNCVVTGYPKMDIYLDKKVSDSSKYWKEPNKFKIIYAPHHSFGEDRTTNLGTFLENGNFILELAKKHQETTWILKPHPWFKYNLTIKNKIMTVSEFDDYYNQWREVGNIVETGDYFDIFKTSDLMITDSASFLGEYLPTGKPLIRLIKNEACLQLNDYGKYMYSKYYDSHSNNELEQLFNELVVNKNDYKYEDRKKIISEYIDFNEPVGEKIYKYILNDLGVIE